MKAVATQEPNGMHGEENMTNGKTNTPKIPPMRERKDQLGKEFLKDFRRWLSERKT